MLGKAIKQHQLPRDEIVVMTKVLSLPSAYHKMLMPYIQVFFAVGREYGTQDKSEALGYVNQSGLSRKVNRLLTLIYSKRVSNRFFCLQHIFESVKHSLDRLQLDYVDVLQCKLILSLTILCR